MQLIIQQHLYALVFLDIQQCVGFVDFLRIPKTRWLPTPILSDAFTAADATSNDGRIADGAGHAETTGLGSGGQVAWAGAGGAIVSNALVITPGLGDELLTDGGLNLDQVNLMHWMSTLELTQIGSTIIA